MANFAQDFAQYNKQPSGNTPVTSTLVSKQKDPTKVIGGYDFTNYATDPKWGIGVNKILPTIPEIKSGEDINNYIKSASSTSPLIGKGDYILNTAKSKNISPALLLAIMKQEAQFGTQGRAVKTKNPGNVGNVDSGSNVYRDSWEAGVDALANNVAKRRLASNSFADDFAKFGTTSQTQDNTSQTKSNILNETKPFLPAAKPEEITKTSLITEPLKAVTNIPSSAINLVKGLVKLPIDTAKNFYQAANEYSSLLKEVGGDKGKARQLFAESFGDTITKYSKDIADKIKGITPSKVADFVHETAINDPLFFSTLLEVGASKLGQEEKLNSLVSRLSKPVEQKAKSILSVPARTAKFVVTQATGLQPETITQISETPSAFSKTAMAGVSREKLGEEVLGNIETKISKLSGTGKAYDKIRQSGETVIVDPKNVTKVFDKYGIKFGEDGKIIRSASTVPLKEGDIKAIEDFQKVYGKDSYFDSNSFLNTRTALSQMSEFDATKSDVSNKIARELRSVYDLEGKKQLTGLKKLDAKYAPLRTEFKQIQKDYLVKDAQTGEWRLKDGAFNKIANLTGKGKKQVLDRLEKIRPGVTEEINILKAVENVKDISGIKPGAYVRGGAILGAVSTGNIPLAFAAILSQPEIAINLIRAYGSIKNKSQMFTDTLINKIKSGASLTNTQKVFLKEALLAGKLQDENK